MAEQPAPSLAPPGDPAAHLPFARLAERWSTLSAAGRDEGRLTLIVFRRADGVRETPAGTRLTLEEGVPGDGCCRPPPRDPETQLAVMRHDVARLIANGQPLTVFGDNLFVDLDISAGNLPTGRACASATPPSR